MNVTFQSKQNRKQTIYWDIDDVIINTTETIVEIINQKYRAPNGLPPKERKDCKDWHFRSIYSQLTLKEQAKLFEGDEFWEKVRVEKDFYPILNSHLLNNYKNILVTKGSNINLKKKEEFLKRVLGKEFDNFTYIGMSLNEEKSIIDMTGGIQIDDNYDNLRGTSAKIKILIKNNVENMINNSFGIIDTPDNLYNINTLKELFEILSFNLKEPL